MKIKAIVIHGKGRGHEIGFPTINLNVKDGDLPEFGVYRAFVFLNGSSYPSVLHYGPRDTFNEHEASLEVHILNFTNDIYGKNIEVEFLEKIRDVKGFGSFEELKLQIAKDVEYARKKFNI